jgi:uncharacterized protein YhbP (UPF0306 family)
MVEQVVTYSFYLNLATSDSSGKPWVSPVVYWTDDNGHFFLVSAMRSRHMQFILQNHQVAVSIYNSNSPEKKAKGLVFGASAQILVDKSDIISALYWLYKKRVQHEAKELLSLIQAKMEEYNRSQRYIVKLSVDKEGYFMNEVQKSKKHGFGTTFRDERQKVTLGKNIPLIRFNESHLLRKSVL